MISLKERTSELEANRDLLLNSINGIKDGLSIADPDGRVILANNKMREIYPELPRLLAKNAHVSEVIRSLFPGDPHWSLDELADDQNMWSERKFPDGRWYRATRTRTDDGGMLCVYSDITTYKEQQSVLQSHTDELVRHLRKEKKEVNEMQREFVSMASHEFRTPLAIIDSNAQRMLRKVERLEPGTIVERLGNIRESVERMQYLINRFLNFFLNRNPWEWKSKSSPWPCAIWSKRFAAGSRPSQGCTSFMSMLTGFPSRWKSIESSSNKAYRTSYRTRSSIPPTTRGST
ncbi:PAS-domain containing protein [Roseibium salinum]|nr:PAS-domain containing protein [Roseibium salinum]